MKNEKIIGSDIMNDDETKKDFMRMDRRTFVKIAGMTAGALTIGNFGIMETARAVQSPQIPLPGSAIPQFIQQLPILSVSPFQNPPAPSQPYLKAINTLFGNMPLTISMFEFDAKVLPMGTITPGVQPLTRVWGYIQGTQGPVGPQETYIGPVIVNSRGTSTDITWINNLGNVRDTQLLAYKYSTDQTLHWADPLNDEMNSCAMAGTIPAFGSTCASNYGQIAATNTYSDKPIPGVVHLHGGEVPPELDGGPDAWFTSDGLFKGHGYYSFPGAPNNAATYKYPNTQEASPIWFHDHVLGSTRLNVYAGLAGGYLIHDPALLLPTNLHTLPEVVPVVIQDRMFDTNGQLFFPADTAGGLVVTPNPEHPYWVPEFVGDTIVVNGKAWPYLDVEAKRYRFLFLNGSNARTYEMFMINQVTGAMGPAMYVIGTDGGYLDIPVKIDPALGQKLVMMPGERYEVIIDFALYAGTNLIIRNSGRTPYPNGAPPNGNTIGRVMQFRVGAAPLVPDVSYNPALGTPLRTGTQTIKKLVDPATGTLMVGVTAAKTRQLTLNEVMGMAKTVINPVTGVLTNYPGGPLEILVNNTKWSGTNRPDFTPITVNGITTYYSELPKEGDTEVWEIVNMTRDAHPIHLHLVQFQVLNRQNYNRNKYLGVYNAAFPGGLFIGGYGPPLDYNTGNLRALGGNPDIAPYLQGLIKPPAPNEAGWKDTVIALPGEVTRIAVRWAPTDLDPLATPSAQLNFPFDPSNSGGHGYVWHCHIIDHEDNEMMRPDLVTLNPNAPPPANRSLIKGTNY